MASQYCKDCNADGKMIGQLVTATDTLCEEHRAKALANLAKAGTGSHKGRTFNAKTKRRAIERLMPLLVACKLLGLPVAFGALTYRIVRGAVPALNVAACQRDLHRWQERCRRIYPEVLMFWYPELTKEGAVHFHAFLFGVPAGQWPAFSSAWVTVTEDSKAGYLPSEYKRPDPTVPNLWNGLNAFNPLRAMDACLKYAAKEVSKQSQRLPNGQKSGWTGRHWGIWGSPTFKAMLLEWCLSNATTVYEGEDAVNLRREIRYYWLGLSCEEAEPRAMLRACMNWASPGYAVKPDDWDEVVSRGRDLWAAIVSANLRDMDDPLRWGVAVKGVLAAHWRPAYELFGWSYGDGPVEPERRKVNVPSSVWLTTARQADEVTGEIAYVLKCRYAYGYEFQGRAYTRGLDDFSCVPLPLAKGLMRQLHLSP